MKNKQLFIGFIASLLFMIISACGPSNAELARLQAIHDDSLKNAIEIATKQKMEAKEEMENSIRNMETQIDGMTRRIEFLKANLEVANDEMNNVKEFHFGRSNDEREQQIRSQSLKIQNIEDEISSLQNNLKNSNN